MLRKEGLILKHVFVILHYLAIEDTLECVNSILKNINYTNYSIVIVDNGSENNSITTLKSQLDMLDNIFIIESTENLGFAKGNNLGYQFAKTKLQAESIIMINNDTIIEQEDFLTKIDEIYAETHYDILGPDIISLKDNQHQNPYKIKAMDFSLENVRKELKNRRTSRFLNKTYIQQIGVNIYKKVLKRYLKKYREKNRMKNRVQFNYQERIEGYKLHGSCYIFSPQYIKKYNGLYSGTFMYMEEDILFYVATKEKMKLLYDPSITIFHKEDSSTNALLSSNRMKLEFIYKNEIDSLKELAKIIENNAVYKKDMYETYNG